MEILDLGQLGRPEGLEGQVSRKRLVKYLKSQGHLITEQKLSRLLNEVVYPHVVQKRVEVAGAFTGLGLDYLIEFFNLNDANHIELGNMRRRWVLAQEIKEPYNQLYKSYQEKKEPETVEAQLIDSDLETALVRYEERSLAQYEDLPKPTIGISPEFAQLIGDAAFAISYNQFRPVIQPAVAEAMERAFTDSIKASQEHIKYTLGSA